MSKPQLRSEITFVFLSCFMVIWTLEMFLSMLWYKWLEKKLNWNCNPKLGNNVCKSFAVHRVSVTHLEFRLQIGCHRNLIVFPTKNANPVACKMWRWFHQLCLCTESPKGDAYIGLSQPQSNLTVPARRTVEGWYFYVALFQNWHLANTVIFHL